MWRLLGLGGGKITVTYVWMCLRWANVSDFGKAIGTRPFWCSSNTSSMTSVLIFLYLFMYVCILKIDRSREGCRLVMPCEADVCVNTSLWVVLHYQCLWHCTGPEIERRKPMQTEKHWFVPETCKYTNNPRHTLASIHTHWLTLIFYFYNILRCTDKTAALTQPPQEHTGNVSDAAAASCHHHLTLLSSHPVS